MTGHGAKFGRKKEEAIVALLQGIRTLPRSSDRVFTEHTGHPPHCRHPLLRRRRPVLVLAGDPHQLFEACSPLLGPRRNQTRPSTRALSFFLK